MGDEAPSAGRRPRFHPTDHLACEAIAAYVDGELAMLAYLRAAHHLSVCPECTAEVDAQQQARIALRQAQPVAMPTDLHDSLTRIPLADPGPRLPAPRGGVFGFARNSWPGSIDSKRWSMWWRK